MGRAGRIAAVTFIAAGLLAIPASAIADSGDQIDLWPALLGIVPGVACLLLPWERLTPRSIHAVAALGTAIIAAATVAADPVYAAFYVFVAAYVARTFMRPGPIAAQLGLICVALALPIFVGANTGQPALTAAMLALPAVILLPAFFGTLAADLEGARASYQALSRQDELTGVGNYRALRERLDEEMARHGRRDRRFALILVDLNGFKEVNELHGHLEGDRVLAEVGAELRATVRAEDAVFRQGGDEFSVLAPETGRKEANELAGRLRDRLDGLEGVDPRTSACTGAAIFPDDGKVWNDLLAFADVRLFSAKRHYYEARPGAAALPTRDRAPGERARARRDG